jgi:hypothetical protein
MSNGFAPFRSEMTSPVVGRALSRAAAAAAAKEWR